MNIREAAVAGLFYEADAGRLQRHVDGLLAEATAMSTAPPEALIVPHAGLIYSGSTAARAYRCLMAEPQRFNRVLLLGPAHRVYLSGMAIPSVDYFMTPLGKLPLDRRGLDALGKLPGVVVNDEAHREEHSLEVQLPFLQTVLNDFSLMPVVIGGAEAGQVAAVIDAFGGKPGCLVVISSDLSHFHDYRSAERLDAQTCDRILARETGLSGEEACGARAINGLMASEFVRSREIRLLHRCNSGDTAGKPDRVVGYGAFALH